MLKANIGNFCSGFGKNFENPKMLVWTCRMQFRKPCRFYLPKVLKFFDQNPELIKKWHFFRKHFFSSKSSSGHVNRSFDNAAKKFSPKLRNFFAQSQEINNNFFSKNILILKLLLWKGRIKFWQTCRKFFTMSPKIFCSKPNIFLKKQKKIFKNLIFLKMFPWTRRVHFS